MPPKKAAKKVAKKAAKKVPAKGVAHGARKATNDTRRAYEHLGRVLVLAHQLPETEREALQTLAHTAELAMRDEGSASDAADLLRAAEHFGFGTLSMRAEPDQSLANELLDALREEFDHLRRRAVEHGEAANAPKAILSIYKQMSKSAQTSMEERRFRAALEFARGAEALTHVSPGAARLPVAGPKRALPRS